MPEDDAEKRYEASMLSARDVPEKRRLLWQEQSIPELGGLTPIQYFDSIDLIEDLIILVSLFVVEGHEQIPPYLQEKIKKIDSKDLLYLHEYLSDIRPTENTEINALNSAVLYIIQILGLPEFIPGLVKILEHLTYPQNEKLYYRVSAQLMCIGEPALDSLMQA